MKLRCREKGFIMQKKGSPKARENKEIIRRRMLTVEELHKINSRRSVIERNSKKKKLVPVRLCIIVYYAKHPFKKIPIHKPDSSEERDVFLSFHFFPEHCSPPHLPKIESQSGLKD